MDKIRQRKQMTLGVIYVVRDLSTSKYVFQTLTGKIVFSDEMVSNCLMSAHEAEMVHKNYQGVSEIYRVKEMRIP